MIVEDALVEQHVERRRLHLREVVQDRLRAGLLHRLEHAQLAFLEHAFAHRPRQSNDHQRSHRLAEETFVHRISSGTILEVGSRHPCRTSGRRRVSEVASRARHAARRDDRRDFAFRREHVSIMRGNGDAPRATRARDNAAVRLGGERRRMKPGGYAPTPDDGDAEGRRCLHHANNERRYARPSRASVS